MQDRLPKYPGRVLITPENGGAPYYATMTRADEPEQEGTPLNKYTFLKDSTANALGLNDLALPDDALMALKTLADTKTRTVTGSYTGTGTYGQENPNSLTFDFVPKLILFTYYYRPDSIDRRQDIGILSPDTFAHENYSVEWFYAGTTTALVIASIDGNVVSWYSASDAGRQRNAAGCIYHYIAFG